MNSLLQVFLVLCALIFTSVVISLLLKNRIGERFSVIWLAGALMILLIAGNPSLLDKAAGILGIQYPPSLLFLLSTLVLLLFGLYQSIQITKLSNRVKDVSQFLALNRQNKDIKEQREIG